MANRMHNLEQTKATFQVRGLVTGMKKEKAYQSGTAKNGGQWNSLDFGIAVNNNKIVFLTLKGFPRNEVYYYKAGESKGEKGTTVKVPWKDRKKSPGKGYRLIGVNISVGKDKDGNNVNEMFTEYDAVEYLHEALSDGDSLFVKGNMVFYSYTDRSGQVKKKIEFNPTQISYTKKPIDFDAEDFEEMAEFENTLVFSEIGKEMDEDSKATGRFVLSGYSIGYSNIETVSFIIDADHSGVANAIRKKMKPSNSIKTYGRISIENNIESVLEEDDWGNTEISPMERINAPVKREYIVYKVDGNTFETEKYSEEKIAAAIKAINQAKEADNKFVAEDDKADNSGWDDDIDDGETPWD